MMIIRFYNYCEYTDQNYFCQVPCIQWHSHVCTQACTNNCFTIYSLLYLLKLNNNTKVKTTAYIYMYVSKCSLYTFYNNPAPLNGSTQFHYCTDSNPGTGADDAFVLKRGVWRNATWPSHSRPAIAASAHHFQICFLPEYFDRLFVYLLFVYLVLFMH